MKRKNASGEPEHTKRVKLDSASHKKTVPTQSKRRAKQQEKGEGVLQPNSAGPLPKAQGQGKGKAKATTNVAPSAESAPQQPKRGENIRKLAPPRPFPTVPTSVSASGPKSAHKEGKNLICITRHTPLAGYLSRCKKLLVDEGHHVLNLHAMGAAIPHLLTLCVSLPAILPFPKDDIQLEVRTGTIEVLDEVIPDDEDEDISVRTRGKGGVSVILIIRGGADRVGADNAQPAEGSEGKGREKGLIVVPEQEQDDEEMT